MAFYRFAIIIKRDNIKGKLLYNFMEIHEKNGDIDIKNYVNKTVNCLDRSIKLIIPLKFDIIKERRMIEKQIIRNTRYLRYFYGYDLVINEKYTIRKNAFF